MDLSFGLGDYDSDGDLISEDIHLYCGENIILVFNDLEDLEVYNKNLIEIIKQIKEQ